MTRITLEICVDDEMGIKAAAAGGADRIELCAALALGGLTPSAGLMRLAAENPLPAMAMIRPRAGDFVWTRSERAAMLAEIAAARSEGMAGVVIGASLPDGRLDEETLHDLIKGAAGLELVLHRAIDLAPDPAEAMALCASLGIGRVLSSGGAQSALKGVDRLKAMIRAAPGVVVMPGGGISAENIGDLAKDLPLVEVHSSCSALQPAPFLSQVAEFGFLPPGARRTEVGRIRALRSALDQIAKSRPSG